MGYIGVNGVARPITSLYVGVSGVARKVTRGYIGVNGIARLWWDADSSNIPGSNPILKERNTWYSGSLNKSNLHQLHIVDSYEPTGNEIESWAADIGNTGAITCYLVSELSESGSTINILYIAGDGTGRIIANPDSTDAFSSMPTLRIATGFDVLDTSYVTNMRGMFRTTAMYSKELDLDLRGFDTSQVTDMEQMFYTCGAKRIDVSTFNPGLVKSFYQTFASVPGEIIFDEFNTRSATNMYAMFQSCGATSLDLSSFDTSHVTTMRNMFESCDGLTELDLSSFDTSNVTNMSWMFTDCNNLANVDLSKFDTSKVTTMQSMFETCYRLTNVNVSNFNTSNVTNMNSMFFGCRYNLKTLNLISFDTSNVVNMAHMFGTTPELTNIYVGDGWTTENADTTSMFSGCGTSAVTHI